MAQYYYSKYTAVLNTSYTAIRGSSQSSSLLINDTLSSSYTLNPNTGVFTTPNHDVSVRFMAIGSKGYAVVGGSVYEYAAGAVSEGTYRDMTATHITSQQTSAYQMGSLVSSNISAENGTYPTNGRHSDGYWYVRGSAVYVPPGNTAPTTPGAFTQPSGSVINAGANITVAWGASTDADGNTITYYPEYRYYMNGVAADWVTLVNNGAGLTRNLTITSGNSLDKIEFRVRAYDGTVVSAYRSSAVFTIQHNAAPTLSLNTTDNQTLYENGTLNINGTANDPDIGNVVSVKFKVNGGITRTIDAKVVDGTPLAFDRPLTFKQGILYDGATAITGKLDEGVPHSIIVWSEDDQGGKSADVTRAFLVVTNRPPTLIVNPIATQSDLINKDMITIAGTVSDPENDNVTVSYKLNGGAAVQVHNGVPGAWTFNLQLKNLQNGINTVVIEAVDSYDAKTSKTLRVTKTHNAVPLKNAVAMWKINAPSTTTKEVLAWVQRELGDLAIDAEISMTNAGEQENFVPMNLTNTAPVGDSVIEDEFDFLAAVAKENIVLKLNLSRTDTASQKAIKLISGVLE